MKNIEEILSLAKETGDRLIVIDQNQEPFVVMNLASYRSILREETHVVHLSERELLEKINRLVSAWKIAQPNLADYDLAQFRVDSLRTEPVAKANAAAETEPVVTPYKEDRASQQEELLSRVIDTGLKELPEEPEDIYYPEPEVE